jgi:hypothetical protein
MFISSILLFAYNGATGTSVSLTAIPAISWWSIAYLVVLVLYLLLLPLFILQNLPAEISSVYAYILLLRFTWCRNLWRNIKCCYSHWWRVTLFGLYLVIRCEDALRSKSISYFQLMY